MIPAAESERDAAGAGFDEAAGHEEMLHHFGRAVVAIFGVALAVALANFRVFFFDVERFEDFAGGQHAEGLFVESVEAAHQTTGIDVAAEGVETFEQGATISEAFES